MVRTLPQQHQYQQQQRQNPAGAPWMEQQRQNPAGAPWMGQQQLITRQWPCPVDPGVFMNHRYQQQAPPPPPLLGLPLYQQQQMLMQMPYLHPQDEVILENDDGRGRSSTNADAANFWMYVCKVARCPFDGIPHNWRDCLYLHHGEGSATRRRHPQQYPYRAEQCPDFKNSGFCRKGDSCDYAHGAFEAGLHPDVFRTSFCEHGNHCPRRICFFAHDKNQSRPRQPAAAPTRPLGPLSGQNQYHHQPQQLATSDYHQALRGHQLETTVGYFNFLQQQQPPPMGTTRGLFHQQQQQQQQQQQIVPADQWGQLPAMWLDPSTQQQPPMGMTRSLFHPYEQQIVPADQWVQLPAMWPAPSTQQQPPMGMTRSLVHPCQQQIVPADQWGQLPAMWPVPSTQLQVFVTTNSHNRGDHRHDPEYEDIWYEIEESRRLNIAGVAEYH